MQSHKMKVIIFTIICLDIKNDKDTNLPIDFKSFIISFYQAFESLSLNELSPLYTHKLLPILHSCFSTENMPDFSKIETVIINKELTTDEQQVVELFHLLYDQIRNKFMGKRDLKLYKNIFALQSEAADLNEYNILISKIKIPLNWAWDIVDGFVSDFYYLTIQGDSQVLILPKSYRV